MDEENLIPEGGELAAPEIQAEEPASLSSTVREAYDRVREGTEGQPAEGDEPRHDRGDGRDPRGRFASRPQERQEAEAPPAQPHQATPQAQAVPQAAYQAPVGWTAEAKAKFGSLPPEVQQAVAHREEEINRGFQILQNYRGLEEFHPYIARANTTYRDVMGKALAWEQATIADPIGAIAHLCQIRGIPPQLAAQALLDPKVAAQVRAQNPYARGPQQQSQRPPPLDPNMARQIADEVFARRTIEQKTSDEVASFLKNPQFPHVAKVVDDMVLMINSGRASGLEDAYQMAVRLHNLPQTVNSAGRASAVNQARRAAKAVTGAPTGGQTPGAEQPTSAKTVRSAARIAYDRALGGI